jgi:hypothetical protein
MAIEFACQCGKKLRAGEEHAGRRARCNHCGQVSVIPAPKMKTLESAAPADLPSLDDLLAEQFPPHPSSSGLIARSPITAPITSTAPAAPVAPGGRSCPSCRSAISAEAVLCVQCGYNLNTGKKISLDTTSDADEDAAANITPPSKLQKFLHSRMTSWKVWNGLGLMGMATVMFIALTRSDSALMFDGRSLGVCLIMFIAGGVFLINGLCDGDYT